MRSPELASYYESAIDQLQAPVAMGRERVRVSSICHAIREFINGLPSVMGESSSKRIGPSIGEMIRALDPIDLEEGEGNLVWVPRKFASIADSAARAAIAEEERIRKDLVSLLSAETRSDHPLVAPWNKTRKWFVKWAHWDRSTDADRSIPTDIQILTQLRLVEDVVEARTVAFFDARHSIEDVLAIANETTEEPAV